MTESALCQRSAVDGCTFVLPSDSTSCIYYKYNCRIKTLGIGFRDKVMWTWSFKGKRSLDLFSKSLNHGNFYQGSVDRFFRDPHSCFDLHARFNPWLYWWFIYFFSRIKSVFQTLEFKTSLFSDSTIFQKSKVGCVFPMIIVCLQYTDIQYTAKCVIRTKWPWRRCIPLYLYEFSLHRITRWPCSVINYILHSINITWAQA